MVSAARGVRPRTVWGALTAAMLTACAAPPPAAQPDSVDLALRAAIDEHRLPSHAQSADAPAQPARLSGAVLTVRQYVGDAAVLLQRVATSRGLTFRVTGPEPRLPLLIAIDVEGVPFETFLSDVGYQFGQRADLVLTAGGIEIRYRGTY